MHGEKEVFPQGNIDFNCIRKLNLVFYFVTNHGCDLLVFELCSVHNRNLGGSGRRIICFHQIFSLYPLWKSSD